MNRCKVCDQEYKIDPLSRFQEEGYCPVCDAEISLCLMDMENLEEEDYDDNCYE